MALSDIFGMKKEAQRLQIQLKTLFESVCERQDDLAYFEGKLNETYQKLNDLEKEIEFKKQTLEELNSKVGLIDEILVLEAKMKELQSKYQEMVDYQTMLTKKRELEDAIASKSQELEDLKTKLKIGNAVFDLHREREELEKLKMDLDQNNSYDPKNLLVVAYRVPNVNEISIGVFNFVEKTNYNDSDLNECVGTIYQSIGGSRTIGFNAKYDYSLKNDKEPRFNATPKRFITFEEVCIAIGSDLYLRKKLTAIEINNALNLFKSGFYADKQNITQEEFLNLFTSDQKPLDGSSLVRLLEKGETN